MEGDEEQSFERKTSIQNDDIIPVIPEEAPVVVRNRLKCPETVEPIVFGVFLADALADSITTSFLIKKSCEIHFHYNKSICSKMGNTDSNGSDVEALVQPYASVILTGMNFLSVLLPAIMSLFVGPWSDYNGRKLLLIIPSVGYFVKYILLGVFAWFPNIEPTLCLVAVLPVAFSGGIVNFISAAYSYISDITLEENRSFRIIVLESFAYSGSIIGMVTTSYIYNSGGNYGYVLVYGIAAGVILLVTIPTYFRVPESVQTLESGKGIRHMFELKLFKEMLQVCFKKRDDYGRAVIFLVIISLTLTISISMGESNVMFLFTRLRFGWNIKEFTIWSSVTLAIGFFGLLLGTVTLAKWLKTPDAVLGLISYALKTVSAFFIAFIPADAPNLLFYSGLINIFGGICGPASRAVLSKTVPKEDIGKVFALTGSSEALFPLAFGPLYTFLYDSTIDVFPSSFLLLSGSLFALCSLFFIIIYFMQKAGSEVRYGRMEDENQVHS